MMVCRQEEDDAFKGAAMSNLVRWEERCNLTRSGAKSFTFMVTIGRRRWIGWATIRKGQKQELQPEERKNIPPTVDATSGQADGTPMLEGN